MPPPAPPPPLTAIWTTRDEWRHKVCLFLSRFVTLRTGISIGLHLRSTSPRSTHSLPIIPYKAAKTKKEKKERAFFETKDHAILNRPTKYVHQRQLSKL